MTPLLLLLLTIRADEALPPWTPGHLDIHQIDTGRGNAAFIICPDGSTILIDAGDVPDSPSRGLELGPRRQPSLSTGQMIAAYIKQFKSSIDWALLTHHHDDHVAAIADLAAAIPIGHFIDRGLDPAPPPFPAIQRYLAWRNSLPNGKLSVIAPGKAGQLGGMYPGFEIRNVAANGAVWTGKGDTAVSRFPNGWPKLPADMQPNENQFSIALRIRYGKFDYFTGGDLVGTLLDGVPQWHDLETPVAEAIGAVDIAVLNHHGWLDSTNEAFLRILNPRAVIVPAWHASHPDHGVMRRLRSPQWKPAPPDLFITRLLDAPRAVFSYMAAKAFKSAEGHIVVRVAPGGSNYSIFILKDSAAVAAEFGPYPSR